MHLDPWHLRLQMEKLKIKNQRVPLFCAQFFLINNHGTESNHIKPIKPHCFCLTSFVLLQSFSEESADTIPPGLFGGERHMEVSNRCHYYPDIHHLTGTTLVGCSHLCWFSMCRLLSLHPRHHWGRTLCSSHRGRHTFVGSKIRRTSVSVVSWPLLPGVWLHCSMSQLTKPVIQRTNPNVQFTVHQWSSMYIIHQLIILYSCFFPLCPQLSGPFILKACFTRCKKTPVLNLSIPKVLLISNPWRDRERKAPARHRVHSHLQVMSNWDGPTCFNQISMCFWCQKPSFWEFL